MRFGGGFNPVSQATEFDPNGTYIRDWVRGAGDTSKVRARRRSLFFKLKRSEALRILG